MIKIHRLGRTSFRAVRKSRDYMAGRSKASWLYMSRLAALKEYAFMKALFAHNFPVPTPIDHNRHVVVMSRVRGYPMAQIKSGKLEFANIIFDKCMNILRSLAEHGLIHCDFNEFNLMLDDDGNVTLIDFPQMVSTGHINADELLERDINGLVKFFAMKMKYVPPDESLFCLEQLQHSVIRIDEEVRASGFDAEADENIMEIDLIPVTKDGEDVNEDVSDDDDGNEGDDELAPEGSGKLSESIQSYEDTPAEDANVRQVNDSAENELVQSEQTPSSSEPNKTLENKYSQMRRYDLTSLYLTLKWKYIAKFNLS